MPKDTRTKSRYWAFIYYPESPIKDYKTYLIEHGARAVISPWHDQDINELDDEIKKKHKHIILCYESPTTESAVKDLIKEFKSPIPIPQVNFKAAVKYLTHSNNPEKAQYKVDDIELVGYDSLSDIFEITEEDIRRIWTDIKKRTEEGILEYSDICDFYLVGGYIQEFSYVVNHTIPVGKYLDSKRHKQRS